MSDPEQALQTTESGGDGALAAQAIRSVPIQQIKGQVQDIQEVMDGLMKEGTHYDDVTGDGRNSLLQPGAEKLCFAFQFAPSFESERTDIPPEDVPNADEPVQGHREYEVECKLHHRPSGQYIGSGRGSCSTLESKYRYRKEEKTTDIKPPQAFWDSYDKDQGENMGDADFSILRDTLEQKMSDPPPSDADVGVEFVDNSPYISYETGRKENPDIADQYNTVLKMAEKRALVNAVKRCTAASDIFTQDTEDLAVRSGSNVRRDTSSSANTQQGTPQKPDQWYEDAIDWIADRDATWSEIVDHADHVPSKDHPLKDWPDEWWDEAKKAVRASGTDGGSERKYAGLGDAISQLMPAAREAGMGDVVPEDRRISSEKEHEDDTTQLERLMYIADQHGWKSSWLDRLIKDELGFESKKHIPWGDPYDQICDGLEDQELKFWASRDPNTKEMEFPEDDEPNDEAFEDGTADDSLPF